MQKLLIILLVSFLFYGCSKDVPRKQEVLEEESVTQVKIEPIYKKPFTKVVTITSQMEASEDLTLSTILGGKVEFLRDKTNSVISKGDVLAEINSKVFQQELVIASINVSTAKKMYQRQYALFEKGLISDQAFEAIDQQRQIAEATFQKASLNLENAVLISPIDGVLVETFVDENEFVMPGTPIVNIINLATLKINVNMSQDDVFYIQKGMVVDVEVSALSKKVKGTITYIGAKANEVSKTFPVEISVKNPSSILKAGLLVSVNIPTQKVTQALFLRQDYVLEKENQHWVMVEKNGRAEQVKVDLGYRNGEYVLIQSGLEEGDKVIVEGYGSIKPSDRVSENHD